MSQPDTVPQSAFTRAARAARAARASSEDAAPDAPETKPVFIDPDRPFGQIIGQHEQWPDARYQQDGRLFNANGELIHEAPVEKSDPRVAAAREARLREAALARERYRRRMADIPGSIAMRVGDRRESPESKVKSNLRAIVEAGKRAAGMAKAEA